MAEAAATTAGTGDAKPVYHCRNCQAELYSPYHTICPRCAEPIDYDDIRRVLGRDVEIGGSGGGGSVNSMILLGIVVLAAIIAGLVMAFSGGGK